MNVGGPDSAESESQRVAGPTPEERLADRVAPAGRRTGCQRWSGLLFGHWTVDPAAVQATLPEGLWVDTFEGAAYLGVVPFFMQRVRPRWAPAVPWLSWFLELNVRTYVHDRAGRAGVWFYSLDCNQPVAVTLARRFYHLPYEHAAMSARRSADGGWRYVSRRRGEEAADGFEWKPVPGRGAVAAVGTLEFFLIERYRLFSADRRGRVYSGCVRHAPYRVHRPEVTAFSEVVARRAGFDVKGAPVSLLAAEAVDVRIHALVTQGRG